MIRKIIVSVLILLCSGCTTYLSNNKEIDNNNYITIDSIKINEIVKISSIKNDVEGIIMFEEYGRPNINKSNTVIGAHSGSGNNAYFNNLIYLVKGDIIKIKYKGKIYQYIVSDVYEVDDKDTSILNEKEISMITLLTCKIGELNKRIVVVGIFSKT